MDRRYVLQLLGVASVLAVPHTSTAQQHVLQVEDEECELPQCIHPTVGYVGFAGEDVDSLPENLQPDHEVELVTEHPEPAGGGDDEADEVDGLQIPAFYFEPTGLAVEAGDIVQFTLVSPDHTVTAYHPDLGRQRRVPEGVQPFSSPVLAEETIWLYRFEEPGVYDLLCAPHEIFGMVMRVVVDEPETDFGEEDEPGQRGPELTADLVLNDDALVPGSILEEGEISWESISEENKRLLVGFEDTPEEEDEETAYVDEVHEQVTLEYGETAELSNGVTFTILGLRIYETLGEEEPDDRDAFVVVQAEAGNTSDEERTLPGGGHTDILFGDVQDRITINSRAIREGGYERYEGDDVQPGVHREGVILFEIDEGYGEDEIDILWQDSLFVPDDGEVDVRWTAGG